MASEEVLGGSPEALRGSPDYSVHNISRVKFKIRGRPGQCVRRKKNGQRFAVTQGMGPRTRGRLTCEALVPGEICSFVTADLCQHQQRVLCVVGLAPRRDLKGTLCHLYPWTGSSPHPEKKQLSC